MVLTSVQGRAWTRKTDMLSLLASYCAAERIFSKVGNNSRSLCRGRVLLQQGWQQSEQPDNARANASAAYLPASGGPRFPLTDSLSYASFKPPTEFFTIGNYSSPSSIATSSRDLLPQLSFSQLLTSRVLRFLPFSQLSHSASRTSMCSNNWSC